MGWPQYTYLALIVLGLGMALAQHGEPRTGSDRTHNFFTSLIAAAISVWLLWAGDFFG